jgi:hypothetical protein
MLLRHGAVSAKTQPRGPLTAVLLVGSDGPGASPLFRAETEARPARNSIHTTSMPEDSLVHLSTEIIEQCLKAGLMESDALAVRDHLRVCAKCRCRVELLQFWIDFSDSC